ncbi:DgyrCDS2868 [Dimorphilus gyrociliatus]|uniref:DgyrCDS2868 n=1 Tax=Dimorphilus gyrociliatus TaxID=2664684 RepID=A0A7I8VC48_9ANNE|nr:DgyrCDS2868 [Dimorphilus gyrociliatus]
MATVGNTSLHAADIAIIIVYFIFILTVGLWLGASLFASNIGSLHFIGLAGSGAAAGIAVGGFELNAIFVLMMLGWLFMPVYIASGVFTMPEYLHKRFGGQRLQIYLAVLSLLLYIFTKISADLFAGAIFIEQSLKWNIYLSTAILLVIASIFTITGGLTAVIWTDFIQTGIMLCGAFSLMIMAFIEVGGFENMKYKYERSIANSSIYSNSTCGLPRKDYLNFLRSPKEGDVPWPGLLGITFSSIWYWCADQVIVQRTLSGKNFTHAKAGCVLAGYLKLLPLFLLIFPGMISRILYTEEVACIDPDVCYEVCKSRSGCTNTAYPKLVLNLMPNGARGVMLAVILSALMSSLTSIFNSSSTVFTLDVWKRIRKNAQDFELMIVGRLTVVVLVGISIAWVPIIQATQGSQLFVYVQRVSSFLQPPVCAVYVASIFWSRMNEQGAFWSAVIGLGTGLLRFILEIVYGNPQCGEEDNRPSIIKNFHYLYFGIFVFFFTVLVAVVVSLLTKPLPKKYSIGTTFWSRYSKKEKADDDLPVEVDRSKETVIDNSMFDTGENIPWYKKAFFWICGIEKQEQSRETSIIDDKMTLKEDRLYKWICNINAVILLSVATFMFGFFS